MLTCTFWEACSWATTCDILSIISLEQVSKRYGKVLALQALDLRVAEGDQFGFLGQNGAGKTTAIRILMGFLKATSGSAKVFGLDAWKDSVAIKARIGYLQDAGDLYNNLTGEEVLEYLGRLSRKDSRTRRRLLVDRFELSDAALKRKVKGYSRGMRQKVAIIQALQHEPDLMMMDEPTEGLDPLMQQTLFSLLAEVRKGGGTVFMSSHKLSEVEEVCNRVAIIREGSLVAFDEVRRLRERKVRRLEVEFRSPPQELRSEGVQVTTRDGNRWSFLVSGDINPILRELAGYELVDLVLEPTHLEDIFMDFYRRENDPAKAGEKA